MSSTQKLSTEAAHTNTRSSAATSRMRAARPANRKPKLIMMLSLRGRPCLMSLALGARPDSRTIALRRDGPARQRVGVIRYPTGV